MTQPSRILLLSDMILLHVTGSHVLQMTVDRHIQQGPGNTVTQLSFLSSYENVSVLVFLSDVLVQVVLYAVFTAISIWSSFLSEFVSCDLFNE